jgi:4-amino-4-deoxy-L-arabinose transferase-like glycosyltransferase
MIASSIMLGFEARTAKTDAMLLLTVVAAMGAMARAYLAERAPAHHGLAGWVVPAFFWTALGAGILLKGPLILLFVALAAATLFAFDRSARWFAALRPLPGLLWLAALVLPWFLAIASRSGASFFMQSVGQDMLAKVVNVQETHGAPPGYYFALFWITFWPGATLAAMAAPAVWAARREKGARFLLAWIVPTWIAFELAITKLPHYVLPLYPAVAILIAGVIDPHLLARNRWLVRGTSWWFIVPVVLGVGSILCLIAFGRQLGLAAWPFAAGAAIFGLWAWQLYDVDGAERSLLRAMVASFLLAVTIYGLALPSLVTAFPSAALAGIVRESGCRQPRVAAAGFHEPSLVFLLGTEVKLADAVEAADFLRQGGCRFALIEARHERIFLRRAEVLGLRYPAPERFDGYNYSNGRAVSIAVYHSEAAR